MVVHDLSFFSDPLRLLITPDKTVFVNWEEFVAMTGTQYRISNDMLLEHNRLHYASLSFILNHLDEMDIGCDAMAMLVRQDFFRWVVMELGVGREEIARVHLDGEAYRLGFVTYDDEPYVLASRLNSLFGSSTFKNEFPYDVPRMPVAVIIKEGMRPMASEDWLIQVTSLPYLQSCVIGNKGFSHRNHRDQSAVSFASILLQDD